jgi:chromosome segregation ATPase
LENESNELATSHESAVTELTSAHEEKLKSAGAMDKIAQENLVGLGISLSVASAKINDLEGQLQKMRATKSLLGARLADAQIDQLTTQQQMQTLKASKSLVGAALSRTVMDRDGIENELQLTKTLRSRLGAVLADNRIAQDAVENQLDTMKALRSTLGARLADNRLQQELLETDLQTTKALRSRLGAHLADNRLQQEALQDKLMTTKALRSRLGAFLANADLKQQVTENQMHQVNWERDKALDQWQAVQTQLAQSLIKQSDVLKTMEDKLSDSSATIDKLDSEKAELVVRMAGAAEARDAALAQWKVLQDRLNDLSQKVELLETKFTQ